MYSLDSMPSPTSVVSAYTAFAASAMLLRTMTTEIQTTINQIIPEKLRNKIFSSLGEVFGAGSSEMTLIIDQNVDGLPVNEVYDATQVYLKSKITPANKRLKVSKGPRDRALSVMVNKGEEIIDIFEGIRVKWVVFHSEANKTVGYGEGSYVEKVEHRSIELSFCRTYKEKVLNAYLPYVMECAKSMEEENKVVKIHTFGYLKGDYDGTWGSINLEHPSTFETLAMDPEMKKALMDDLDRFVQRRDYYKRVGKAWKRGYLLYGPPGTGKSSLVAAMANYLKFHIYDLQLTFLRNNDLRSLMVSTANRSILLIEDIDCSIESKNRQARGEHDDDSKFTLSAPLNFIDGLWSSCGDERIIIFTTNYKERLDAALLRPGRMDMHIHMSYLTAPGFKILASNYFNVTNHHLFPQIEDLIAEAEVTPAQVAEELMKSNDVDVALQGLVKFLREKKSASSGASQEIVEEVADSKREEKILRKSPRKWRGPTNNVLMMKRRR
ncbi:hypothetical protein Drorol1_Dr00003519 [Drosera rotundifolia]